MPSSCLEGFVEEPQSGLLVPLSLRNGKGGDKALVCSGIRVKRVMVDIQVYVLAVYIAIEDVPDLTSDVGKSSCPTGQAVMQQLLSSKVEKVFQLSFLRQLTRKQVADGFSEGLANVGVCQQEIEGVAPLMPLNIQKGDVLTLTVRPTAGDVLVDGSTLHSMELCNGLQEVFLGPKAVLKGVSESARKQWPVLLQVAQKLQNTQGEGSSESASGTEDEVSGCKDTGDVCKMESDKSFLSKGDEAAQTGSSKRTWKEKAGRSKGKDGYKFGDITRSVLRRRGTTSPDRIPEERPTWKGALVVEDQGIKWVSEQDVVPLDNVSLQQQRLDGNLLIHHQSAAREVLQRQWTERYFELVSGALRWRKQLVGMPTRDHCLEGCHVVVETPMDAGAGQFYVFSVWNGRDMVCRMGTPQKGIALRWILALAGTCAFFHNLENGCASAAASNALKIETAPAPAMQAGETAAAVADEKLEDFIAEAAVDNPQAPPTEEEEHTNGGLDGQSERDREVEAIATKPFQAGCDCAPQWQASSCCLIFMVPVMVSACVLVGLR